MIACLGVCKQWHQEKEENAGQCRAYRKEKAQECHRKDRERKPSHWDYINYVTNPTNYEEFKRQDRDRKAAKKAIKLATYAEETETWPVNSTYACCMHSCYVCFLDF